MTTILWPHQVEGKRRLLSGHALLAWEPGAGKTFPAIAAGAQVEGPQLYICPASLRLQIADEARRLIPTLRVQVIERGASTIDDTAELVICSYDMAAADALWKQLFARSWGSLVLDEAHYLKNKDAKRTRAIYGATVSSRGALYRKAKHVWALTGTPVLNSPADLWTHYSRLFPDAIVEEFDGAFPLRYRSWIGRYCVMRYTQFGEQIVGAQNVEELRRKLAPYLHRVTKEEVIDDLPELTIDTIRVNADAISIDTVDEEARDALAALRQLLEEGASPDELAALAVPLATLQRRIGLAKAQPVAELIRDELSGGPGKIIVFGLHPDVLRGIAERIGAAAVVLDGRCTPKERNAAIQAFQRDDKVRVFCGQLYAAGTGLNLQIADRVIFAEAAWTPAVNEQGIARAHRAGQKKNVRVSFIALRGSIDEQVQKALARKARMVSQIIEKGE